MNVYRHRVTRAIHSQILSPSPPFFRVVRCTMIVQFPFVIQSDHIDFLPFRLDVAKDLVFTHFKINRVEQFQSALYILLKTIRIWFPDKIYFRKKNIPKLKQNDT